MSALHTCVSRLPEAYLIRLDSKVKEFRDARQWEFTRAAMARALLEMWIDATRDWTRKQFVEAIRPALVPAGRREGNALKRYRILAPLSVVRRLEEIVDLVDDAIPKDVSRAAVIRTAFGAWFDATAGWTLEKLAVAIRPSVVRRGRKKSSSRREGGRRGAVDVTRSVEAGAARHEGIFV